MNRRFQRWHPALCANPPEWPAAGFEAFQTACRIPDVPDCISLDVPTFSPNREQATLSGFLYAVLLPLDRPALTDLAERPHSTQSTSERQAGGVLSAKC